MVALDMPPGCRQIAEEQTCIRVSSLCSLAQARKGDGIRAVVSLKAPQGVVVGRCMASVSGSFSEQRIRCGGVRGVEHARERHEGVRLAPQMRLLEVPDRACLISSFAGHEGKAKMRITEACRRR